jgi:SAM-dependent methyltransferase
MSILLNAYNFFGKVYLSPILNREQKKRPFPLINERSAEYSFALKHLRKLCTGKVLDIGSGKSSWPHLLSTCGYDVKAIDKIDGYWSTYFNRHYKMVREDITQPKSREKFQFITCLSVLEHIADHKTAVSNMHEFLETGGYLILTFPFNDNTYHPDIYKHPEAGYGKSANFITQVFSRNEVNSWLNCTSFKIVEQEYYKIFSGKLWTMGDVVVPAIKVTEKELHHLTCILLQRTGD